MVLGIVVALAGVYLFTGAVWARTIGVIIALLWAIIAFVWLPVAPVWSILHLVISVFVIAALTLHGRDITRASIETLDNRATSKPRRIGRSMTCQ